MRGAANELVGIGPAAMEALSGDLRQPDGGFAQRLRRLMVRSRPPASPTGQARREYSSTLFRPPARQAKRHSGTGSAAGAHRIAWLAAAVRARTATKARA